MSRKNQLNRNTGDPDETRNYDFCGGRSAGHARTRSRRVGRRTLRQRSDPASIMINPDDGGDTTWDVGSVDAGDLGSGDKLWSRIGVKASHELDGGMTAGVHVEKRLDNFRTRIQKVSLSGEFGTLALGQQWTTYYNATTIDGMSYLGGFADTRWLPAPPESSTPAISAVRSISRPWLATTTRRAAATATGTISWSSRARSTSPVRVSAWAGGMWITVSENVDLRVAGAFGPMNYSIGGGTQERADGTDSGAIRAPRGLPGDGRWKALCPVRGHHR